MAIGPLGGSGSRGGLLPSMNRRVSVTGFSFEGFFVWVMLSETSEWTMLGKVGAT